MLQSYILLAPFFQFITLFSLGRTLGERGAALLSIIFSFTLFLSILYLFISLIVYGESSHLFLPLWFFSSLFEGYFHFLFDGLTLGMLLLISIVSGVVQFYSLDYMKGDPHKIRFLSYLAIFAFFMIVLVSSGNLLLLFIGWEGVGLASYLLISFWSTRLRACKGGLKAVLFNRVGDMGLLYALLLVLVYLASVDFDHLYPSHLLFSPILRDIIILLFFVGLIGKSAQLGLHLWLEDAMEGPTPVSALIHAATMVTAGVFLFIRLSFFLTEGSPFVKGVIGIIGFGTAFVASMTALFQNDVKRIIAFSTCSQLGYMVGVIALSGYLYSLYHLINHGFFKALLFLSAGLIIHAMREEQDLRRMGGLFYNLPITYLFLLVASASLIGFPYLSGFYSKELIIQYTYLSSLPLSLLFYHLALFTIVCTTFYSFRLLFYVFLLPPRGSQLVHQESEEDGSYHGLYDLLFLLFFLSIFSGYLFSDLFFGVGTTPFDGAVAWVGGDLIHSEYTLYNSLLLTTLKSSPFVAIGSGLLIALLSIFYSSHLARYYEGSSFFHRIFTLLQQGAFFNHFYIDRVAQPIVASSWTFFLADKSFFERIFPLFSRDLIFGWVNRTFAIIHSGYHYTFYISSFALFTLSAIILSSLIIFVG